MVASHEALTHTMRMHHANQLSNHFLIAMPTLRDSVFNKSVIYLHEHTRNGAMGLIINKPLQLTLGNVLRHLKIDITADNIDSIPVYMGGPVGQENGFVLHSSDDSGEQQSLNISASKEILRNIAKGKGPKHFLITLGYSSWQTGQLETEIARNDWLIAPGDKRIIFDIPVKQRWQVSANMIGIDIYRLTDQIGHA